MIINAHAAFMTEGPLPEQARQRLEVLGKRVRLINSNLWEFEFEFRTEESIDQPFAGNEDYSWVALEFTLADATSLVFRTVIDTLTEFHAEGEVRMVSAEIKPQIMITHIKEKES